MRVFDQNSSQCYSKLLGGHQNELKFNISKVQCNSLVNINGLYSDSQRKAANNDQPKLLYSNLFTGYIESYGKFRLIALNEKLIYPGWEIEVPGIEENNPLFCYKSIIMGKIGDEIKDASAFVMMYQRAPLVPSSSVFIRSQEKSIFVKNCFGNECSNLFSNTIPIPGTGIDSNKNITVLTTDCLMQVVTQSSTRSTHDVQNQKSQFYKFNSGEMTKTEADLKQRLGSEDGETSYNLMLYCVAL